MTPHRRHLLEMRATRPDATAADVFAAREATIRRRRPVERPPADATARHLAEMRAGREAPECQGNSPAGYAGHWRDWHCGHGCNKDPEVRRG